MLRSEWLRDSWSRWLTGRAPARSWRGVIPSWVLPWRWLLTLVIAGTFSSTAAAQLAELDSDPEAVSASPDSAALAKHLEQTQSLSSEEEPEVLSSEDAPADDAEESEQDEQVDPLYAELPSADTSGVTGKTISVPKGEGTIQGMEESFSAQLSTGIATFNVPIALPQGRGKVQPSLALSYSSAGGLGETGAGWSIGVPFIARQTDKGVPQYDDEVGFHAEQDRFVFNGGQELVPICDVGPSLGCPGALLGVDNGAGALSDEVMPAWAAGWQYFRARVEGSFLRFFWSPDRRTWRVQDKSGTTMELGAPLGSDDDNALESNPLAPAQIYRWRLSRQYDVYGGVAAPLNGVSYRYRHDGGMAYLADVYWTPPAAASSDAGFEQYAHHARLVYESRTDPTGSYRSGWLIEQRLRLVRVEVASKPFAGGTEQPRQMVRKYHLSYADDFHVSLLEAVQVEGRCADTDSPAVVSESGGVLPSSQCPRLPPMRFGYSHVAGYDSKGDAQAPPLSGYEAFDSRVRELHDSPSNSLDEALTRLMDVNQDSLPDVLVTAAGLFHGNHGAFLNGGQGEAGHFQQTEIPVVGPASAGTIKLSNFNVVPLDLDGNAAVDLLHMPRVKKYSVYSLQQDASGRWYWGGREIETASGLNPSIDFGGDARHIRVFDVNFDGLVDVVRSTGTELQTWFSLGRYPGGDGQFGQARLTGPESAALSNDPVRTCLPWAGTPLDFEDRETQLADMNGDGITDIVRLRRGDVRYWPGRGNGYFGTRPEGECAAKTFEEGGQVAMADSPYYSDLQGTSMRMEDVNGDGLTDLVQVRFDEVDVYLNVDGVGWTKRAILSGTPKSPAFANRVRLTDINGSGTSDILWGDAGRYRYIDLTGGVKPHLLVRVENGLGKTTELEYQSSAQEMLAAAERGEPWTQTMPTVSQVVTRVTEHDNVTIAGRPPASYVTEYHYRDPVFEGRQREFRGFAVAEAVSVGDQNSPTSISRSHFLLGECEPEEPESECDLAERWRDNPKEALKGLPVLTETLDETGTYLSSTLQRYVLRRLYTGLDGRDVRYAFQAGSTNYLYDNAPFVPNPQAGSPSACTPSAAGDDCALVVELETGGPGAAPEAIGGLSFAPRSVVGTERLRSESLVDYFGNKTQELAYGREGEDEVLTQVSVPALLPHESGWLFRTQESYVLGSEHPGRQDRHTLVEFDANGDPTRQQAVLFGSMYLDRGVADDGAAPLRSAGVDAATTIVVGESSYDIFGNPTVSRGANLRCSSVSYDPDYATLPVVETAFTRGCTLPTGAQGAEAEPLPGSRALVTSATYDRGLGLVTTATNVQQQSTAVTYDGFGRLTRMVVPHPEGGASSPQPSVLIDYYLPGVTSAAGTISPGPNYSLIRTRAQDAAALEDADYLESWALIDGLGRTITTLSEDSEQELTTDGSSESVQRWIVGALQEWDQKGAVRRQYIGFYTLEHPLSFNFGLRPLTPYGRQRYDAFGRAVQTYDLDGTVTLRSVYHALSTDAWDAADLQPGPHQGTYLTTAKDGHGRTLAVTERFKESGALVLRTTSSLFLPTGEPEVITRSNGTEMISRWFAYDTLGRMVLNVEPNTSVDYTPNLFPNLDADHQASHGAVQAYRYAYNDAGDLVGMSDSRGCGANYFYDGLGRLLAEDYFPCESHQSAYSAPELGAPLASGDVFPGASGAGLEVRYTYDEWRAQGGTPAPACGAPGASAELLLGQLVAVEDLGSESRTQYDARGRVKCVSLRPVAPYEPSEQAPAPAFAARYGTSWFAKTFLYDAADRVTEESTGATQVGAGSVVETVYSSRGTVERVESTHGTLVSDIQRTADGLVTQVTYGDAASTTTSYTYDDRRRIDSVVTARAVPPGMWSGYTGPDASTYQLLLQDETFKYDVVGNPIEIRDGRIPEEWEPGAKPVTRKLQYDDLYRLSRIDYEYTTGDDTWKSPFEAELTNPTPPQRGAPSPHVAFAKRILWQTYAYDWRGNNVGTSDDADGFYDRSLGVIENGTPTSGPYRLQSATGPKGTLSTTHDACGNMTTLTLERWEAGCADGTNSCLGTHYEYEWDEIGRLIRATRFDTSGPNGPPGADLRYHYDSSDNRTLKTARDSAGAESHTAYVFPSLELRGAQFGTDYELSPATEVPYLFANGVRLGRVVNDPAGSGLETSGTRVFFELGDHLGSTSVALDKATGELVERATYQAYGGAESSYRPERWGSFREDYRFTGKEEDVEVGLVYFGKRYLNPLLQRWVSADPLEVHQPGKADANSYAYVSGRALSNTDPLGLDVDDAIVRANFRTVVSRLESRGGPVQFLKSVEKSTSILQFRFPLTLRNVVAEATGGRETLAGYLPAFNALHLKRSYMETLYRTFPGRGESRPSDISWRGKVGTVAHEATHAYLHTAKDAATTAFIQQGVEHYRARGVDQAEGVFHEAAADYVAHRIDMWDEAGRSLGRAQELAATGRTAFANEILGEARQAYNEKAQARVFGYDRSGEGSDVAISSGMKQYLDSTVLEGRIGDDFDATFSREVAEISSQHE